MHTQVTHCQPARKSKASSTAAHGMATRAKIQNEFICTSPVHVLYLVYSFFFLMHITYQNGRLLNQTTCISSLRKNRNRVRSVPGENCRATSIRKDRTSKVSLLFLSVSTEEWLLLPSSHDLLHPVGTWEYMASPALHRGIPLRSLLEDAIAVRCDSRGKSQQSFQMRSAGKE